MLMISNNNSNNSGGRDQGGMASMATCSMDVAEALVVVLSKISAVSKSLGLKIPRLVAVTKTKNVKQIKTAYDAGQRHFGENYAQELLEKATNPLLVGVADIRWHFIGHLQTNKCKTLVSVPNLWMVETVDSKKLANALNSSWSRQNIDCKLKIMIQVNTSKEQSKSGCQPEEVVHLSQHIWGLCPKLELCGLMTIGKVGHDYILGGPNPDFIILKELRAKVCSVLELEEADFELSMGMSGDFEEAIKAGSTNVRVGSAIFGTRNS